MPGVDIGSVGNQQPNHLDVARPRCIVKGSASQSIPRVDVDASGKKFLHLIEFSSPHGRMQSFGAGWGRRRLC
jgi:hypothetical protein